MTTDNIRRGDLVTVVAPGDYGKPRPALVIQADQFEELESITVVLLTGTLVDAPLIRIAVEPDEANGLHASSHLMVDKTLTVRRDRLGQRIGRLDDVTLLTVTRSLSIFLGLA